MACSPTPRCFMSRGRELPRVLLELHATLKPGGVLFSSNPRGDNQEGWSSERYCVFHDLEAWRRYVSAAGFVELTHYYRPDDAPRERQPWLCERLAQIGSLKTVASVEDLPQMSKRRRAKKQARSCGGA